jgi:hypothetical protein
MHVSSIEETEVKAFCDMGKLLLTSNGHSAGDTCILSGLPPHLPQEDNTEVSHMQKLREMGTNLLSQTEVVQMKLVEGRFWLHDDLKDYSDHGKELEGTNFLHV